jgi:hypothetical protein
VGILVAGRFGYIGGCLVFIGWIKLLSLVCEDNLIGGSKGFLLVRHRLRRTSVRDMGLRRFHPWGKLVLLFSRPVIGWECVGGNDVSSDAVRFVGAWGGCGYSAVANVLAWITWDDSCETIRLAMGLGTRWV